jgi:exodeoxyribonuclease-5
VLVLAGAAGTGKTTLMRVVIDELAKRGVRSVLAAPTGKAALRLQEVTGKTATTVHRLVFANPSNAGICAECGKASEELGISQGAARRRKLTSVRCPECGRNYSLEELNKLENVILFSPKEAGSSDDFERPSVPIVAIIDEASMVSRALDRKIRENLPPNYAILYVGDKEQLPPVGKGEDAEWGPDWEHAAGTLTTVHRQAAGNPIINLATRIREDKNEIDPFKFTDPDEHLPMEERRVRVYDNVTLRMAARWLAAGRRQGGDAILITWMNRTRVALNELVRKELGLWGQNLPVSRGDRMMVLNNNPRAVVANGEIFNVASVRAPESPRLRQQNMVIVTFTERPGVEYLIPCEHLNAADPSVARKEFLDLFREYTSRWYDLERMARRSPRVGREIARLERLSIDDLFEETRMVRPEVFLMADFAECITAHKSQGSQWDTVGIVWDHVPNKLWCSDKQKEYEDARRWLYTAVTRAQRRLVILKTR